METSTNFSFNLPSRDNDDIADINQISDNFRIIDEKLAIDQTFSETSENPQSGTAIAGVLSGYVSAEVGKGLSSNDYTDEEKEKLAGIEEGAEVNAPADTTYNPESANAQSGIAVAQAVETCSPAIVTDSDTGKTLSIPDSSESVMRGLTAYGESVQDGTPAPDSPVEIVSIENPAISVYGKNLIPATEISQTVNGITFTSLGDGTITMNGTSMATASITIPFQSSLHSGTYTLSFNNSEALGNNNVYALIRDDSGAYENFILYANVQNATKTITINQDKTNIMLIVLTGTTLNSFTIRPQLEVGSVATPYEPYIEPQTVTLPYTFRGLKNSSGDWVARDELRVGNGKVEIVRNVGYLVCTSNLTWAKSSVTATDLYYYTNSELFGDSTNSTVFPKCTHFIAQWDNVVGHFYIAGGRAYFNYAEYGTTTLEDWKTFLDTANMSIIWASNKGTVEDITATESGQALLALKSNYPSTSVISDIDLDITYKADTKNYIDNKIAALTALTLEG